MTIRRINPEGLSVPRGYSHAVSVSGEDEIIYIGGQNGIDRDGNVVGSDLRTQTAQILRNIETILEAAGGSSHDLIKLGIHVLAGQNPMEGFQAFQEFWGESRELPAITVIFVSALGMADWLVEIDGVAAIPKSG